MKALRFRAIWPAIIVAAVALAVGVPAILGAQEALITISDAATLGKLTRPAVRFPHADHMALDGVDCFSCHHRYEQGKNVLDATELVSGNPALACVSCHAKPGDLLQAYHGLCLGCHDAEKRQGKVTGPRGCGECHQWGT